MTLPVSVPSVNFGGRVSKYGDGEAAVEEVQRLRVAMSEVDPALLNEQDRLALLDLFERAHQQRGGGQSLVRRRSSAINSSVEY